MTSNQLEYKNNFTSGELSPDLLGRGDLSFYSNGAKTLNNVLIQPTGGIKRRFGLRYIGQALGTGRLISFEFNTEQNYLMVLTNQRLSVYKDDNKVAEISTPWTAEQLKKISWTQSADTLLIAHPDIPTKQISRLSHTNWQIANLSFSVDENGCLQQPYYKYAGENVTISSSGTSGTITLTSSAAFFSSSYIGLRLRIADGEVEITSVTSSTTATASVIKALSSANATISWKEPAFSQIRGYPTSLTYHQSRLVLGGSKSLPNRLWLSKSADLLNFDLGTGLDDEAIEFAILSDQVNAIIAVFSSRHLQVFTSGSEWMVTGSPLTPTSIELSRQTRAGSPTDCYIPPMGIDGATIFISGDKKQLCEFLFSDIEQAYQATDLSLISKHLLNEPLDQDYDSANRIIYIVMSSGKMAAVTNYRSQKISGWSSIDTSGKFLSVSSVGSQIYCLVLREDEIFIEKFDETLNTDSALTGSSSTAKKIWSGLEHLSGKEVKVVTDGTLQPDCLVDSQGHIEILSESFSIEAGLGYEHIICPLPLSINASGGTNYSPYNLRLISCTFRIYNTSSIKIDTGKGAYNLPFNRFGSDLILDEQLSPQTKDVKIHSIGWKRNLNDYYWKIISSDPLPFNLLSATSELKIKE